MTATGPTKLSGDMVPAVERETVRATKPPALDPTLPPTRRITFVGGRERSEEILRAALRADAGCIDVTGLDVVHRINSSQG